MSQTFDFGFYLQDTVAYSNIREVKLGIDPIQRIFGLGTVTILTNATPRKSWSRSQDGSPIYKNTGLKIYNVAQYQEIYDHLMKKSRG